MSIELKNQMRGKHFAELFWLFSGEASVDVRPPATGASNHDNERDRREEVTETRSATTIELERAKALSEEARKVLSDLNMGTAYMNICNVMFGNSYSSLDQ